jgi:hypothetical protein
MCARGDPLNPHEEKEKNKGDKKKMSNYFVIGFRKVKTAEEYKNKIVGHNHRNRNYKNRVNINTSKSKNNIILSPLKYKSASELIDTANQIIKEENVKTKKKNEGIEDKKKMEKLRRGLKKGSSFGFEILIDCSKIEGWENQDYIKYLKEANEWLQNKFTGQEVLSSVIHLDEGKPHLHITFSYFNTDLKKWNQRGLKDKNLTNLNYLLRDFEREVGSKFGLKKGDNNELKERLYYGLSKGKKFKIKTGLFSTKELVLLDKTKLIKNINKVVNKAREIGEVERLKEELIKKNKEVEEIKEKAKKEAKEELEKEYKQQLKGLEQQLQEQEEALNKAILLLKQKDDLIEKKQEEYNTHIEDIQNRLKNRIGLTDKQIREITKFEKDDFTNQYNNRGIKSQTNTLTR